MSIFDDIGKFLANAAPTIVRALPLPPPLGAMAASVLASALGTDKTDAASLQTALSSATPEQLLLVREAENKFAIQMKQFEVDFEKIAADDRASARATQIQVKDKTVPILAFTIITAFLCAVFLILSGFSKAESVIAGTLIGYLSAKAEQVVAYYFGSSSGSKSKDAVIAKTLENGK